MRSRSVVATTLVVVATTMLGACATRNLLPDGAGGKAMLGGQDAVSYHAGAVPVRGEPQFTVTWDGAPYYFASGAHRDQFSADPARYAPQYGGWCAEAARQSLAVPGRPDVFALADGRLFLFADPAARERWQRNRTRAIEAADYYWATELKNTWSAPVHTYRRGIFRVPQLNRDGPLAGAQGARPPQ